MQGQQSGPGRHYLAERMAELSRSTSVPRSTRDVLTVVTDAAVELIGAVDAAGILLIGRGGRFESLAGTSEISQKIDALQERLGEGPCIQAALHSTLLRSDDFRTESRWPRYAAGAVELGVLSGMSFKLYAADRTAGALNLFSFRPNVWRAEAETIGTVLAAHAASALLASREGEQLHAALLSRDRIGQAKGIIMERFGVDEVRAFGMLQRLSQESNTRLVDIAARVIDTRNT